MSLDATITLGILAAFLATALSGRLAVDFALAAAMTALMLFGVLLPEEALQGSPIRPSILLPAFI